jgi:N-acetylmuramoyl-L-alanine amidase
VSHWRGESDINSASIGIEIQNPGHNAGYPAFPVVQMMAVRNLSLDICRRNGIGPEGVLAHSDVAPGRKIDPGERFDWPWLARAGVGHWVAPEPIGWDAGTLGLGDEGEAVRAMQLALARYGYGIEATGVFDARAEQVVAAFQRHFRPQRIDGRYDASTAISLRRLSDALAVA